MGVLFVCTGNYYRSRFAEAVWNHAAERVGHPLRATSRGLEIHRVLGGGDLSPVTVAALSQRGIERRHTQARPVQLVEADLVAAGTVVVLDEHEHRPMMAELFPRWEARVTYWRIGDVDRRPAADALAEIEAEVSTLRRRLLG